MKDNVKLILIGDEGVGKSSLISSYISRHFPSEVPFVMTDAVIPAQTTSNDVCVTVMDSSSRVADLEVLKQKLLAADSVIALYDVTRDETFENLGQIWFPLLTELFGEGHNKPVLVVGTKTDLLSDENDVEKLRSLLERFPFVLACLKCSALQLQDVEDIFHYGVDAVTYPLEPIFDIFTHEFKPECRKAFLRIFRALDSDNDNLLSDAEMRSTELKCFNLQITDDELVAMKRQISQIEGGLKENFVTFDGFLGLIKLIIEDTSFRIPWQMLRRFDYDDDLDYMVPEDVSKAPLLTVHQVSELSPNAREFLLRLAITAHLECDPPAQDNDSSPESEESLSWDALNYVLSVIPSDVAHPWSNPPTFLCVWREDSVEQRHANRSLQQSILLNDLPHIGANISFEAWLSQWHVLAMNNPVLTQELLFRLGYIERSDVGTVVSSGPIHQLAHFTPSERSLLSALNPFYSEPKPPSPRSTVNIAVLGGNCVGKSSLVWNLTGLPAPGTKFIEKGLDIEKPQDTVIVGGCHRYHRDHEHKYKNIALGHNRHLYAGRSPPPPKAADKRSVLQQMQQPSYFPSLQGSGGSVLRRGGSRSGGVTSAGTPFEYLNHSYYLNFAAIPLEHATLSTNAPSSSSSSSAKQSNNSSTGGSSGGSVLDACDLVVLMFQCGDIDSLKTAQNLEKRLPRGMPRVYVASKLDLIQAKQNISSGVDGGGMTLEEKHRREVLQSQHDMVYQEAALHLQTYDLPPLVYLSTVSGEGLNDVLAAVVEVVESPDKGIPVKQRQQPSNNSLITAALSLFTVGSLSVLGWYLWGQHEREIREWYQHIYDFVQKDVLSKIKSNLRGFSLK